MKSETVELSGGDFHGDHIEVYADQFTILKPTSNPRQIDAWDETPITFKYLEYRRTRGKTPSGNTIFVFHQ